MTVHYAIHVVPDEHKNAYATLLARVVYPADDPETSQSVSQPLNATGNMNDPYTNWYGGAWLPINVITLLQTISENVPEQGWPINHFDQWTELTAPVTYEQALAAAQAAMSFVVSAEGEIDAMQAEQARQAMFAAMNLKTIDWGC